MATTDAIVARPAEQAMEAAGRKSKSLPLMVGQMLASLWVTVFLFLASILLVFFGTLAQVEKDMWEVMNHYFFSWVAAVEWKIFFPRGWFGARYPSLPDLPGAFPFPGGMTLGFALAINLLAAHTVRFRIQATGRRLQLGLLTLAIGIAVTTAIIVSGHNQNGLQGSLPISWRTCWLFVQIALVPLTIGFVAYSIWLVTHRSMKKLATWLLGVSCGLFTLMSLWVWFGGESSYIGDSGMRILWQLVLGTLSAGALLIGCQLLFKRRGGIALIHSGVGLLMFGQLFVNFYDKEEQVSLVEQEAVSFSRDIRSAELVLIDAVDRERESVIAIPLTVKAKPTRFQSGKVSEPELPVDFEIVKFMKNADLRRPLPDEPNLANMGEGRFIIAEPKRGSGGAAMSEEVDLSAAYVRFFEKGTDKEIGTVMLAQEADVPERIRVGDKNYDLFLRFARSYKPYTIELLDVRKDDYVGTSTPRNYSSDIRIVDASRNVDTTAHIWMNNPLRYAGETFYQSGYKQLEDGTEATTLQIVRNTGWMIPYVACMLVVVGLTAHFSGTFLRFLDRASDVEVDPAPLEGAPEMPGVGGKPAEWKTPAKNERRHAKPLARGRSSRRHEPGVEQADPSHPPQVRRSSFERIFVAGTMVLACLWVGSKLMPRRPAAGDFDLQAFARLPVLHQGRAKPMDTLARSSLRMLSDQETFKDETGKTQPAIRWLLDLISTSSAAEKHRVVRIQNLQVLELLGLEARPGFRYSIEEIKPRYEKFEDQVRKVHEREATRKDEPDTFEQKLVELDERLRVYTMLMAAFIPPNLPPFPDAEEFLKDRDSFGLKLRNFQQAAAQAMEQLDRIKPPLSVPARKSAGESGEDDGTVEWTAYGRAVTLAYAKERIAQLDPRLGSDVDPATALMTKIFVTYKDGDVAGFNEAVAKYSDSLRRKTPAEISLAKLNVESEFNRFAPFDLCSMLYVLMFFLSGLGLLGWVVGSHRPFNQAALWLGVLTLMIHTGALLVRIYLSGRPPVTNLYSSAVYIGWFCVLVGIGLEAVFRVGIGNLAASMLGFGSLIIAQRLSNDGDTLIVLQAVLDTQFWLATHVVSITTGYATTFFAGLLGIAYILGGLFTPALARSKVTGWTNGKLISTMIYGIVCFSLVFSFTGTVLGGLWADDSWGRFWGWDPKENGALIIVLWNALILHARWGGIVKERGMATLAVLGNVVTAWSWFGVNQLGKGLHAYGGSNTDVLLALGLFVFSQFVIAGIGLVPKRFWKSFGESDSRGAATAS